MEKIKFKKYLLWGKPDDFYVLSFEFLPRLSLDFFDDIIVITFSWIIFVAELWFYGGNND